MLKWREDYYVGEGIKDAAKARRRIDAGRVAFGVYLSHCLRIREIFLRLYLPTC